MFGQDLLSEIRDRIPISGFIGERIPLKKAGRNFKGLCPFHNEKTPSFMVSDDKQIYHCFGCGEGGDLFTFFMKYEGLTFTEAVKSLAERAGVAIPEKELNQSGPDAESARRKKWALRVNQIASEWFKMRLNGDGIGECARKYLISRGIKSEIYTQLNLGVADKSWDALSTHLKERGVPLKLAAELGLVRERGSSDGYYDFFRGRLIFPISSPRGELIAFGGRTLENGDEAKYLNSPDSMIFHKSMSVYGLNWAAEHIRRSDQVLIVEGYMDVVGLVQCGIRNVVAPLGTALTSGHIRLASRLSRNMVLIFDGDEAGMRAALRSLPMFVEWGSVPRVVLLPQGEDPDSFVRKEGPEAFEKLVSRADSLFEFYMDQTIAKAGRDSAGKVKALSTVVPLLRQMKDLSELNIYRQRVAEKLDVPESVVRETISVGSTTAVAKKLGTNKSLGIVVPSAEKTLIDMIVQRPDLAPKVMKDMEPADFGDGFIGTIAELFKKHVQRDGKVNITGLLDELADPEMERELRSIAMDAEKISDEEAQQVLEDCIRTIRARPQRERMRELNDKIKLAEREGNDTQLFDLLRRKKKLTQEIYDNGQN